MIKQTGIIILAAGSSSRLGTPKQLLNFAGKSLLRHITDEASQHADHLVTVVLGAGYQTVQHELVGSTAQNIVNANWQKGMSSSISLGLQTLLEANPTLSRCIIAVCDQPFINAHVFEELISQAKSTGKGIVVTGFSGTWGVPVLFTKKYFHELLSLDGPLGAKKIVKKHLEDTEIVPYEKARIDIDTKDDYYRLEHTMVTTVEAKEIISFHLPEPTKSANVPLHDALGYTLATDVLAPYAIPNFAQSSMDGYAIRYVDCNQELAVTARIPAGDTRQKKISNGQAARIFTGAPLPLGADSVVMQEKVQLNDNGSILVIDDDLQKGDNVRLKGSEVEKNALAIQEGTFLTPAALGYLAAIGCSHVDIYSPPRIAILLTGDELIPPGAPLGFGEVYESNSVQLRGALSQLGIKTIDIHHIADDPKKLKVAIDRSLENADVLLLVGGVSVGDYDFVSAVAKECGIEQRFHRIRQKPGKPMFFGTKQQKPVFGLPGNPSSALTCFYMYVAPALQQLMQVPTRTKKITVPITHDYRKKAGLTHFLKGSYQRTSVTALHAQESYRMQSFAQATCLIVIPQEAEVVYAGDLIDAYIDL